MMKTKNPRQYQKKFTNNHLILFMYNSDEVIFALKACIHHQKAYILLISKNRVKNLNERLNTLYRSLNQECLSFLHWPSITTEKSMADMESLRLGLGEIASPSFHFRLWLWNNQICVSKCFLSQSPNNGHNVSPVVEWYSMTE